MKQTILTFLLVFSAIPAFSQTRADTFLFAMDTLAGTPEERFFIQQKLKEGIRTAGFSVAETISDADYLVRCSVKGGILRILGLALLNTNKVAIDITDLVFIHPDEAYARFPTVLREMLNKQPLKQRPPAAERAAPKTAAEDVPRAPVAEGSLPTSSTGGSSPAPATEGSLPVISTGDPLPTSSTGDPLPISSTGDPLPTSSTGGSSPASSTGGFPLVDDWKYKWLFLNARAGISNRYYLADADDIPTVSIFTVDAGAEAELHLFNVLALGFGINYALDRAEYPRVTTPLIHSTSVLSVPFMLKYFFNTSMVTTLGVYGGGYTNFVLLGTTTPPPLGVLGGIDLAVKAGPGAVLFDLRYSTDLGSAAVKDDQIKSYRRMFLTLSVGYKVGFIKRKARPLP
ncbi:hypothetical protein AGMMS4952_04890 [Spirochaetia bacterium]|nr:hypothetical protein AGMMS4952_04890 [Spirochaetia bacterium]